MNTENINRLLEKFYRGDTSCEEEKILADFLMREDIPEQYAADKKVFAALSDIHFDAAEPAGFEQKTAAYIDSLAATEVATRTAQTRRMWQNAIAIAASLLIVITIGFFVQQRTDTHRQTLADTYDNPNDAYRATMDALAMFSAHYAEGMKPMQKANDHLQKTQKIINETLYKD